MSTLHDIMISIVGIENIKRAGSEYKTYSIFNTEERTPSFFFNENVWKDYSSGKGGNAVTLVMEYFDKTKEDAIEYLSEHFSGADFNFKRIEKKYKTFNEEHTRYQEDARKIDLNKYVSELFSMKFLDSLKKDRVIATAKKHFGYSKKHDSLTISLFSGKDVVQIKTRKTSWAKWVGEKDSNGNFIYYNTKSNEPVVFVVSGIAEIIICEMLDLPYVGLQSDSAVKHIDYRRIKGKDVIVIEDCDATDFTEVSKFYYRVTDQIDKSKVKNVYSIDFRNILDKPLPKGYDFRDFCNEIEDAKVVLELLIFELKMLRKAW